MKKIIPMIVSVIIVLSVLSFPAYATESPGISASSAVLLEQSTGVVLYERDADTKRPPASTTKIITALLALENAGLEDVFTVSASAAKVDGSQLGLLAGDQIKLKDLLYMLMMKSANDAAETIAENIAGSIDKFAEMMNERAQRIGCNNTHFTNPHGLPDDDHYTTARDLAMIAREAMKNENFAQIVSTRKAKLEYHSLVIMNSNKLLALEESFNGVKTGFTKKAGRCLVSSECLDNVSLLCVTLNAPDDWNDHRKLMDYGFERVKAVEIVPSGQHKTTRPVLNGKSEVPISNAGSLYGIAIDGKTLDYQVREDIEPLIFAPVEEYKECGELALVYNGKTTTKTTLYSDGAVEENDLKKEGFFEGLWNKIKSFFGF